MLDRPETAVIFLESVYGADFWHVRQLSQFAVSSVAVPESGVD